MSFDLNIFNEITSVSTDKHDYSGCKALQRLFVALKYYTKLKAQNDGDNEQIFCDFMDQAYKTHVYDDYHHFIQHHPQ